MSCWVAASVAAELWGISVKEVLERVHRGELRSQTDLGFLVVDVAPHSPKLEPGGRGRILPPSTWRAADPVTPPQPARRPALVPAGGGDDEPLGWQERRRLVGASRRAPRAR